MSADLLFLNGEVLTAEPSGAVFRALAVRNGRICFVGSDKDALALIGTETEITDLKGRSLLPGFIDSHLHMGVFGMNQSAIDCRPRSVSSVEEIKEKVAEAAASLPEGSWIRGWGYDHSKLKECRHPQRKDLDEAAPRHPVMLTRTCAHISAHNSLSLASAGITDSSPSVEGGVMERDENGNLNGVMKENAHMLMMKAAIPDEAELERAFSLAGDLLKSQGITTVHDSGGYGPLQLQVQRRAAETGLIQIKISEILFSFLENLDFVREQIRLGPRAERNTSRFRIGPVKVMIDGSSSGPTAATLKPYASMPGFSGILSMTQAQVDEIIFSAHKAGFQVTGHAVGDRAVTMLVSAIEKALKEAPRADHRHRIEHCAMINSELLEKIGTLGIIPVPQPVFLHEFGDGYVENYGPERAASMFPCKSFLERNIPAAGSSDCPITDSDPLLGIHLAVNRITQSGCSVGPGQRVSKEEALRMFTLHGAFASFEENEKGSLKPGKAADLVLLNSSFLACPDDRIKELKADAVYVDGRKIFQRLP